MVVVQQGSIKQVVVSFPRLAFLIPCLLFGQSLLPSSSSSMSHISEGSTSISGNTMNIDGQQNDHGLHRTPESESTIAQARQRRKIAELEGKLEALESGRTMKEK